jgi:hypothetical protein
MEHAYAQDRVGHASITAPDTIEAGSLCSFELRYMAGFFGVDDSGGLKIVQRFASDMETPQFDDPAASGYVSAETSNGVALACTYNIKDNTRPWDKTIRLKLVKGCLNAGDQVVVRFGDRRQGSPGIRMQTFCEDSFELKVLVDAFATCCFTELPVSPTLRIVAGPPVRWRVVLPTCRAIGDLFRLCIKAEDLWGNPTDRLDCMVRLRCHGPGLDLPETVHLSPDAPVAILDGLRTSEEGDLVIDVLDGDGELLTRSNPLRIVAAAASYQPYWADMHGQSEETIGTNTIRDYFRFGRDRAFLDAICHQGNDFQITSEFWADLQRAVDEFDQPGRYSVFPGYEWSGNTGLGGDHNVIFLNTGERIHRSSHALVDDLFDAGSDCHTSEALHAALAGRAVFLYAHVGGRYANLARAQASAMTPAVEIHSAWGTFEWLLHDAFRLGLRPGIVANSDDHKGRPGASYPGAARFGAYGGLTCFLATSLTREAIFDSLRQRRHYATTGARLHLQVMATCTEGTQAIMGGDLTTAGHTLQVHAEALCDAPVERLEFWNGQRRFCTLRPHAATDLGRRIRLVWEGAEYRGRGRETCWDGSLRIAGNSIVEARSINFRNPDKRLVRTGNQTLSWQSITTGTSNALELQLVDAAAGTLLLDTPLVKSEIRITDIGFDDTIIEAGGLGRRVRLYRLPDAPNPAAFSCNATLPLDNASVNPVYVRLVLESGDLAWSSPVYVTRTGG